MTWATPAAVAVVVFAALWSTITPAIVKNPATLTAVTPFFQALTRRKVSAFAWRA